MGTYTCSTRVGIEAFLYSSDEQTIEKSWQKTVTDDGIILSKVVSIEQQECTAEQVADVHRVTSVISHRLVIDGTGVAGLFVKERSVDVPFAFRESNLRPQDANISNYFEYVKVIDALPVCPGNPDQHYVTICKSNKGKCKNRSGDEVGFLDTHSPVEMKGKLYDNTVRSSRCSLLLLPKEIRCAKCSEYRPNLRACFWKWRHAKSSASKFTSNTKLRTPQRKKKMRSLAVQRKVAQKKTARLMQLIQKSLDMSGVRVQPELHSTVQSTMAENDAKIRKEF